MKNITPYIVAGGIALTSILSSCEQQPANFVNTPDEKYTQFKKEVEESFPKVKGEGQFKSTDEMMFKFTEIKDIPMLKINDIIEGYADWDGELQFTIYKMTNPNGEQIRLISDFENLFRGDNIEARYLELKKGQTINHEEISNFLYGVGTPTQKEFSNIDGILIDYKPIKRD